MKQQVHGNVTGVRDTLIEALGQLYDYEVDEDTFLPRELMQVLARFTGVLNREIAVYITRDGEVVDVSIGTDRDVELRDYRLRRNTQRLSCVRCIHTHPNGDGRLSDVDLSALRSFRYDAMVAIGCLKGGPTDGHRLEKGRADVCAERVFGGEAESADGRARPLVQDARWRLDAANHRE